MNHRSSPSRPLEISSVSMSMAKNASSGLDANPTNATNASSVMANFEQAGGDAEIDKVKQCQETVSMALIQGSAILAQPDLTVCIGLRAIVPHPRY